MHHQPAAIIDCHLVLRHGRLLHHTLVESADLNGPPVADHDAEAEGLDCEQKEDEGAQDDQPRRGDHPRVHEQQQVEDHGDGEGEHQGNVLLEDGDDADEEENDAHLGRVKERKREILLV